METIRGTISVCIDCLGYIIYMYCLFQVHYLCVVPVSVWILNRESLLCVSALLMCLPLFECAGMGEVCCSLIHTMFLWPVQEYCTGWGEVEWVFQSKSSVEWRNTVHRFSPACLQRYPELIVILKVLNTGIHYVIATTILYTKSPLNRTYLYCSKISG